MGEPIIRLSPDCSPKFLEEPSVYNRATDELYVLNRNAFDFLAGCGRGVSRPRDADDAGFIDFCLGEGILVESSDSITEREINLIPSPNPSLRYLLLHITERCNLKCGHCFAGEAGSSELSLDQLNAVIDEFVDLQGLRLMISGGEPLLHKSFLDINDYLADKDVRSILLSNGTLMSEEIIGRLAFSEVQISLDGLAEAHDFLRGAGTYDRSMAAVRTLAEAGIQVSVATMIHSRNLSDFDALGELLSEINVREWSIDLPSPAGRLFPGSSLLVDPRTAGPFLSRSFGGAIHEPLPGYACGSHLMAVMADGTAAQCGFYADAPVGTIEEGLAACWQKIPKTQLSSLECDCEFVEECRGGCRFRAAGYNSANGVDLCQCYRFGVR